MRFPWTLLPCAASLLLACGGGDRSGAADSGSASPVVDSSASPAPAGGAVTAAPIIGTVHEVRMIGDANGYRYDPAEITVKPGDGIRFVNVSGGPHNVAFDAATVPAGVQDQLWANMPNGYDGSGPIMTVPNETWTLSLGGIAPGTYPYHCIPHLAMGMKGVIIVEP